MTVFEKGLITIIACDTLFVILAIPLMLRMVPRNILYGYRTRATLADDALWYDANGYCGRSLLIGSLISIAAIWILYRSQFLTPPTFLGVSVAVLVAPAAMAGIGTARDVHQWKKHER